MADRMRQKKCKCCGKDYLYCFHCDADKNKPTWMIMFHDANCMNIFQILTDYNAKEISKEEAIAKLEDCDLSKRDTFLKPIQRELNNIFSKEVAKENVSEKVDVVENVENVNDVVKEVEVKSVDKVDKVDTVKENVATVKSGEVKKPIKIQKR